MASGGGNGEWISLMAGQLQELFSLTPFPKMGTRGRDLAHWVVFWPDSWQLLWESGYTEHVYLLMMLGRRQAEVKEGDPWQGERWGFVKVTASPWCYPTPASWSGCGLTRRMAPWILCSVCGSQGWRCTVGSRRSPTSCWHLQKRDESIKTVIYMRRYLNRNNNFCLWRNHKNTRNWFVQF